MKTVILDENLPVDLRLSLAEFQVVTVHYQGWAGVSNGELVNLVDGQFDVFVTGDKKLRYQQNLLNRKAAIVELPFTRLASLVPLLEKIGKAIRDAAPGSYTQILPENDAL